jgi:ABC-type multidrug transport system fused ATPase/permease subunit
MDERLRRAVPAFGARAAPRPLRGDPSGEGDTVALVRRAWPYIYRYIGGRWIGLGAAARNSEPGESGLLYAPLLVSVLAALAWLAAARPGGAQAPAAVFWGAAGHGLGVGLALLTWAVWAARGRVRTGLGLAGAVVGVASASLVWIAAPDLISKVLGLAAPGAYLAGTSVRVRFAGGFALWLRVESHLVYYYALYAGCTFLIALNTAFLTDLLYQSILTARPMSESFASLIGRPDLAHGALATAVGVPTAHVTANLSASQRGALQVYYIALYFAGFLFSLPTMYVGLPYYWTFIHQRINQNLRLDLMDHWHKLSPRYHTSHRVGDSIYRIYLDSAQISNIISRLQISFMSATSWLTACVIALFFDWRIAALVAGVAIPTLAWAAWYTPRLKRHALEARETTSDLTSRAQEIITGVKVIKAYAQEEREQARFEADSVAAFDAALRARWLFVLAGVVAFTIGALFMLPAIYLMSTWASAARATMAAGLIGLIGLSFSRWNLAAFTWSNGRFGGAVVALRDLNTEWASAQDNTMGLARVFDILDTAPEVVDAPDARSLQGVSREVRFENVGFSYEPGRPVLTDISFCVHTGSVTAIVGPSGSGKSTLMALLLRLFDPDQGRILIDGSDVREFTMDSLRGQIAIAPQEPVLFAASVAENLRYATPQSDAAKLRAAAAVACAEAFVDELPQGWDTVLGERGAGLSPGQKQRLCIARALIKDAPILVLDEPTASLDAETEHRLMQNLGAWGAGRAVFIVTHRLSTIRRADQILFIEDGRVAEAGAHAALMADSAGRYYAMVSAERSLALTAEAAT